MSTYRDRIKQALDGVDGISTAQLAEALEDGENPETLGAIELLCTLSADFRQVDGVWRTTRPGKASAVLAALENYATATGKRIFRSAYAMEGLAAESLPTEEELTKIVDSSTRFELLPNQMIKFNK